MQAKGTRKEFIPVPSFLWKIWICIIENLYYVYLLIRRGTPVILDVFNARFRTSVLAQLPTNVNSLLDSDTYRRVTNCNFNCQVGACASRSLIRAMLTEPRAGEVAHASRATCAQHRPCATRNHRARQGNPSFREDSGAQLDHMVYDEHVRSVPQ